MATAGFVFTDILGYYFLLTLIKGNYGSGSVMTTPLGSRYDKLGLTCQSAGSLNVRNAPGGSVIRTLAKGVPARVLQEVAHTDGFCWYRIRDAAGNENGWVRWDFLSFALNSGGQLGTVTVSAGNLNVRKTPSASGALCNWQLSNGDGIKKWAQQTVSGVVWYLEQDALDRVGWVQSSYVTLL